MLDFNANDPTPAPSASASSRRAKSFWLTMAIGGLIAIVVLVFALSEAVNNAGSNDSNSGSTKPNANPGAEISEVITVESFTGEAVDNEIVLSVQTSAYDTDKYFVEYELTNQNRVSQGTGVEPSSSFQITMKLAEVESYRLQVRLTDKTSFGAWSETSVLKLQDAQGMTVLEPNSAYYSTAWANDEGGLPNFKEALRAAYNIEEYTLDMGSACMSLTPGTMSPGKLLPPIPSTFPSGLTLKYLVLDHIDNNVQFSYVWCEQ